MCEIVEIGVIFFIIGGDYLFEYFNVVVIVDVYGKGKVGVVYFDVYLDIGCGWVYLLDYG